MKLFRCQVCDAISFRARVGRGKRERDRRRRREASLFRPRRLPGPREPMIAVELAHDFDHTIDRLEIPAPHRAVGNEQRLAETTDLDGQKLGRRLRRAARQNFLDDPAHPPVRDPFGLRYLCDRHARIEEINDPALARGLGGARFATRCNGSIAAGRGRRGVA